jgi:hypothetical protein
VHLQLPLEGALSVDRHQARHMNGRNDDWFNVPAETRHL